MDWCGLFGKCPAVVPCATADGESGSSLKLGSCVDQHYVLLSTRKLVLKMFLKRSFAYNRVFPQINPNPTLGLSCALISVITPPWV
jgi:hypothetical protein